MESDKPVQICQQQRQKFIDCMFVNSKCVQSGQKTFQECVDLEQETGSMFKSCTDRFDEFKMCWRQIVIANVIDGFHF